MLLVFLAFLSLHAAAETTGSINTTTPSASVPPTSGVYGYTVQFCSTNSDCGDYTCFLDFDGTAGGSSPGWCNQTIITDCYHDGINYTKGSYFCTANTTYRRCDSGGNRTWGASASCPSGETCSTGAGCSTSSSSSSTTSGGGSGASVKKASVEFSVKIEDFEMLQDAQVNKTVTVKNNGDFVLSEVAVDIAGVPFASVLTGSASLNKSKSHNFTISFRPAGIDVKTYEGNATATTNYTTARASFLFKVKVLPSNKTIAEVIIPAYDQYIALLEQYEKNITALEKEGYDVSGAKGYVISIKSKIQDINSSVAKKDYFTAGTQITEIKVLFDELSTTLEKSTKPVGPDLLFYALVAFVILAAAGLAYLLWPTPAPYQQKQPEEQKSILDRILRRNKNAGS